MSEDRPHLENWEDFRSNGILEAKTEGEEAFIRLEPSSLASTEHGPEAKYSEEYTLNTPEEEFELEIWGTYACMEPVEENLIEKSELDERRTKNGEKYFLLNFRSEEGENNDQYHQAMSWLMDEFTSDLRIHDDSQDSYYGLGFETS